MKILVTGANGMLGRDVMDEITRRGHQGVGADLKSTAALPCLPLDITNERAVERALASVAPDAVVHCASWTAVDLAEDPDNAPRARAVNADGTAHIAKACGARDIKLLYLSTDYVFDGGGDAPWQPDGAAYHPLSVYGESKLAGENAVRAYARKGFVVRTAWMFGQGGGNFVSTMLRLGKTRDAVRVVNDQIGAPTYSRDLARLLADMIESERYGNYHATNEGGYISWYDFAREIFRQSGLRVRVEPVSTAAYGASKAARPLNSRLDTRKLAQAGFAPLPAWQDALRRYLAALPADGGEARG